MYARSLTVEMLTSSHRIVGGVSVMNYGMLGLLLDPTCSYIEVQNARAARIHTANKLPDPVPVLRLVKGHILAVCLNRRDEITPQTAIRAGYTRVYKYPVKLTSDVYEVEGTFEWGGRFDFAAMMAEGSCEYLTLFDATLGAILFPALLIQSPILLFNRNFLQTLVLAGET